MSIHSLLVTLLARAEKRLLNLTRTTFVKLKHFPAEELRDDDCDINVVWKLPIALLEDGWQLVQMHSFQPLLLSLDKYSWQFGEIHLEIETNPLCGITV